MSLTNQTKFNPMRESLRKTSKDVTDFSKVGGLSSHLKTLRDLIIFPLLHRNVYSHFNIKAPRGVLFYGPPGTGKTLVAGALVTEINRESLGRVTFFQRKGADCLDKWVGESEKKLRKLFEEATKCRPSVIFFDEIDGLAPIRSQRNDHVHCSIVSTLLALMDGLDNTSGVVVIGATNRIDSLDPALRRPGRFDKELYFPMPSIHARSEILQVHTRNWRIKPSLEFFANLAENTSGFSGSDLQALCAEAVLCCTKRSYPSIGKTSSNYNIKIDLNILQVEEIDFVNAKNNLIPSSYKMGNSMRKLSPIMKPLLQRQLNNILCHIELIWPHFLKQGYKYETSDNRYAGRMLLNGNNRQGLNTHIVPAILESLEHLPVFKINMQSLVESQLVRFRQYLPSVLILSRVDEWWDHIDEGIRINIITALEDIHAGLPVLVLVTSSESLPEEVHNYYCNNYSVSIDIEDPNETEKGEFFSPLFFGTKRLSMYGILKNCKNREYKRNNLKKEKFFNGINVIDEKAIDSKLDFKRLNAGGKKKHKPRHYNELNESILKRNKKECLLTGLQLKSEIEIKKSRPNILNIQSHTISRYNLRKRPSQFIRKVKEVNPSIIPNTSTNTSLINENNIKFIKQEPLDDIQNKRESFLCSTDTDKQKIYDMWKRITTITTKNMKVTHLEVLYDAVALCVNMNRNNFENALKSMEETVSKIENAH